MSSIAAPVARAVEGAPARWRAVALPTLATVVALSLAYWAWSTGDQPIRGDSRGYYDLALGIVSDGPLSFAHTVRTYGYPFFLAMLITLVGPDPEAVRDAGFVIQLASFIGVAWFGSRRLGRALGVPERAHWIYAATVLCPFILIHSIQMLTDVLSAILVYAAVVLSLPVDLTAAERADVPGRTGVARRTVLTGMLALFVGGLAVIVRPANLIVLPVLLLAWLWQTVRLHRAGQGRTLPWLAWPVLLVMLVLPFVPQMAFNARAYGVPHPLLTTDLYAANTTIGLRTAKYGTITITGIPARLYYNNPFGPPEGVTMGGFIRQDPLGFAATLLVHGFGVFDYDFPFTYITDLNPWYRWYLAVPNFLFLLAGLCGLAIGLGRPSGDAPEVRARARLSMLLLLAAIGALVLIYLPSAVEPRFSLPMYPLLAAPFVLAVSRLAALATTRPLALLPVTAVAAVWVAGLISASLWMDRQAPLLLQARAALSSPLPPTPSATYALSLPEDWEPGRKVTIPITVTNTGTDTWEVGGFFNVAVRAQILALKTEQHRLLPAGARTYVSPTEPVPPGQSATVTATVETPTATGRYLMTVTVIRNGIDDDGPGFEKPIRVDKGR
jgi:hypothetical protein